MTEPQRDGGPRTVDEVSDTVAFYEAEIIVSVGIHLIRRLRRHLPPEGKARE